MAKVKVSKKVLKRAKNIVEAEVVESVKLVGPALPVVMFWYPRHGMGTLTQRFVRVVEMDHAHLRGFEIENEFDSSTGVFKTFCLNIVGSRGMVVMLHMPNNVE